MICVVNGANEGNKRIKMCFQTFPPSWIAFSCHFLVIHSCGNVLKKLCQKIAKYTSLIDLT